MSYSKLLVNLNNLKYNIEQIKKFQNENIEVLAMVKADAYGIGMIEVAKYIEENSLVKFFGVAYIDEAIELKENKIKTPVVILGSLIEEDIDKVIKYPDIIPSISSYEIAELLNKKCSELGIVKKIHIDINTGMNRTGINYEYVVDIVKSIYKNLKNLKIHGIYTHFACSDCDRDFTIIQKARFDNVIDNIKENGINIDLVHICNSAGSIDIRDERYNVVRLGIMMYGYYPNEKLKERVNLKPLCKLASKIAAINNVKVNEGISYGQSYICNEDKMVATVNIGYADGIRRQLSNIGKVFVKGKECQILGKLCMDMCMVDISDIKDVKIGDEVIFFDDKNIDIDKMANICKTINYEILTQIGKRVERVYEK